MLNKEKYRIYNMSKIVLKTDSEDSDCQRLLPINTLYPPNQIIGKKYAPDVKTIVKFISQEKKDRSKVTSPTSTPKNCMEEFQGRDTLGFHYAQLLRTKLIYLKFNSSAYIKLLEREKQIKYLAGMFIPLQLLLSESLRKAKNIYKTLPNLEYIDNRYPYQLSFNTNSFSHSPNLRFTSNYEGSNLFAAIKIGQGQYDLILQNDTNSKGNTQWFNFTVEINQELNYKFNIVNLTKSSSLYQKGMSIAYQSQAAKLNQGIGWTKGCHSITYTPTKVMRQGCQNNFYYSLHFEYKSLYKNDIVTFSYSFPYNLIDLQKFFHKVMLKRPLGSLKVDRVKIAETLTGFPVYVYTFTQRKKHSKKNSTQTLMQGRHHRMPSIPSIVFLSRQHPGQSQSSFVAEGIVQWLLDAENDSWKKGYQFYVVPMINMDGVFYGNYRTNLSGSDLNRIWKQPRKDYHSEIYSLKKYLYSLNRTNPISLIIDIHGHSNSLNSFFYGNLPKKEAENPRFFPYYCSRKVKQISYNQSTFSVTEDKKTCARVVLGQMFPKALVYTFQNSFYGWRRGKAIVEHTIDSYRKLGRQLIQSYVEYARMCDKTPIVKERWSKEIQQLSKQIKNNQEEIYSQSDGDIQNQLVQFSQFAEPNLYATFSRQLSPQCEQKQKSIHSLNKIGFLKYFNKHSPFKLKNYVTSNNNTYYLQKSQQTYHQSQAFLSIIRMNTKSNLDSVLIDHRPQTRMKKDQKSQDSTDVKKQEKSQEPSDGLLDDFKMQIIKQNNARSKLRTLILERQLTDQNRKNSRKKDGAMRMSKSYNGFLRYNYYKKP